MKGSSRLSITPGEPFTSWPRTDRSGIPLLLPYMPAGIKGMSEWACALSLLFWTLQKIVFLIFCTKIRWCLFITSLCPHIPASQSAQALVAHIPESHVLSPYLSISTHTFQFTPPWDHTSPSEHVHKSTHPEFSDSSVPHPTSQPQPHSWSQPIVHYMVTLTLPCMLQNDCWYGLWSCYVGYPQWPHNRDL